MFGINNFWKTCGYTLLGMALQPPFQCLHNGNQVGNFLCCRVLWDEHSDYFGVTTEAWALVYALAYVLAALLMGLHLFYWTKFAAKTFGKIC